MALVIKKIGKIGRREFLGSLSLIGIGFAFGPWLSEALSKRRMIFGGNKASELVCFPLFQDQAVRRFRVATTIHSVLLNPSEQSMVVCLPKEETLATTLRIDREFSRQDFKSLKDHRFYGHGVFDSRGETFFTSESDARGKGRIVVRDAQNMQILDSFGSGGLGPHDLCWIDNDRVLAVANGEGGPSSCIARIDLRDGRILDKQNTPSSSQSLRHLCTTPSQELIVATATTNSHSRPQLLSSIGAGV